MRRRRCPSPRSSIRKASAPGGRGEYTPADGKWTLPQLQQAVDQFVIHYDVAAHLSELLPPKCSTTSAGLAERAAHARPRRHDSTRRSILKEGAWHATIANGRSVGIEIANMGAVPKRETGEHFGRWYKKEDGQTVITIPGGVEKSGLRDKTTVLKPSRPELVSGPIHGTTYEQYDLTPQQYASLIKLTAALHKTFPKIKLDYPRGADGKLLLTDLSDDDYKTYEGVLGHYHVQANKQDPGPAFQWDKVIDGAKAIAPSH